MKKKINLSTKLRELTEYLRDNQKVLFPDRTFWKVAIEADCDTDISLVVYDMDDQEISTPYCNMYYKGAFDGVCELLRWARHKVSEGVPREIQANGRTYILKD